MTRGIAEKTVVEPKRPAPVIGVPALAIPWPEPAPRPAVHLDKTADADELAAAVRAPDRTRILAVLEANAHPDHMAALLARWGPYMTGAIRTALADDDTAWARARVFLGEHLALHQQVETREDKDAVFRDLERVTDAGALALFQWADTGQLSFALPADSPALGATTLAEVQAALRARLGDDDYYKAMRILLGKADRALAVERAKPPPAATQTIGELRLDFTGFTAENVVGTGEDSFVFLHPVSHARVELAEQRIRAADAANGWNAAEQGYLALADLDAAERKALALRLRDRPLTNISGGIDLERAALLDDGTVLRNAIASSFANAYLQSRANEGIGLEVAFERAGQLVRRARAAVRALPPDAPADERARAEAEVARLEQLFFGDRFSGDDATAYQTQIALRHGVTFDEYVERLATLGADPATIGRERLYEVSRDDVPALVAALQRIAPEHRLAALRMSGVLAQLDSWRLSADDEELLAAYLMQGLPQAAEPAEPADPTVPVVPAFTLDLATTLILDVRDSDTPFVVLPFWVQPHTRALSPAATIALRDILTWMDRGPSAAYLILARLDHLSDDDRKAVVAEPRYVAKFDTLPLGDAKSEARDFKDALRAVMKYAPSSIIGGYPGPGGTQTLFGGFQAGPWQDITLEKHRITAATVGQANLRRAYVLAHRIAKDESLRAQLSDAERSALAHYNSILYDQSSMTDAGKAASAEIALGQPQLIDTAEAALDAEMEASYMYLRLKAVAGVASGKTLTHHSTGSPALAEALTAFDALYGIARPGGFERGELAQLAELYHRALRVDAEYKAAKAENEMLAKLAATVAGVVAAVVVTVVTGGALGPVAVAALSAISAGASSAIAGAAVRWEDTPGSILTDFGTGAIEGATAVAGSVLAAKIVRGTAAGVSAGRAAVATGGRAVGKATGGAGVAMAEGAIDGAIGGAAGELFQTAIDEATWDHGVAEGFAKMLAAVARGAAMGAVAGGVLGGAVGGISKLAARAGDNIARGAVHMLDASGVGSKILDDLADADLDRIARATRLVEAGELDDAERVIRSIEGLSAGHRALLLEAARVRAATLPGSGAEGLADGTFLPRIVDDAKLRKLPGGEHADAAVIIEGGEARIIARSNAPVSAIREEVTHLAQWQTDIAMRTRMQRLSEENLAGWKKKTVRQRLDLHLDKLEVEADAQRRIIDQLLDPSTTARDAELRILDAEETLSKLGRRIDTLRAGRKLELEWKHVKEFGLEDQPRLFARGAHTPAQLTGPDAIAARKLITESITDADTVKKLKQLGYTPHVDAQSGQIVALVRKSSKMNDLPHLGVEHGKVVEKRARSSFAEERADAAREWRSVDDQLEQLQLDLHNKTIVDEAAVAAHKQIADIAPDFRAVLHVRIRADTLDEASAGFIAKWGAAIDDLARRSADGSGLRYTRQMFLDLVPAGPLTSSGVQAFRRRVRTWSVDYLMSISDPRQRAAALREMIARQPDNASGGHLYREFRARLMSEDVDRGGNLFYSVDAVPPLRFHGQGLANPRTPDGVVDVHPNVEAPLPQGRYAFEDKTGPGAFKIGQFVDYARRSDPNLARRADGDLSVGEATGGFKTHPESTTSEYDGVVGTFSREKEAKDALRQLLANPLTKPLLGIHPGGIHLMYLDDRGVLRLLPIL